jgi:hypothetical protein
MTAASSVDSADNDIPKSFEAFGLQAVVDREPCQHRDRDLRANLVVGLNAE